MHSAELMADKQAADTEFAARREHMMHSQVIISIPALATRHLVNVI